MVPSAKTQKLNQILPEKALERTADQDTLDLSVLDGLKNSSMVLSPQKNSFDGETKMSKNQISAADILKEVKKTPETKIDEEWELEKKGFTKVINIQSSLRQAEANQAVVLFSLNEIRYKFDSLAKNKKVMKILFIRMSNILGMARLAFYLCLIIGF